MILLDELSRAPVTTNNILFPLELDYMLLDCEVQVLTVRCGITPAVMPQMQALPVSMSSLVSGQVWKGCSI